MEALNPIDVLRQEFCRRKANNPAYSQRSFARQLEIPAGRLSEILNGKRRLTLRTGLKILDRLFQKASERRIFLESLQHDLQKTKSDQKNKTFLQLNDDEFSLIADWYHYAILGLLKTEHCKHEATWLAQRLGISKVETITALNRLQRMGLIRKIGGQYERVKKPLTTSQDISSTALRYAHGQSLQRAVDYLNHSHVDTRDFSSVTIACDPQDMEKAKAMIKQFRRKLAKTLENGSKKEVYELNIQFFPITKEVKS